MPLTRPASRQTSRVLAATVGGIASGTGESGIRRSNIVIVGNARASPSTLPTIDTSTPSIICRKKIALRGAPSARWIPISAAREVALASSIRIRLITLTSSTTSVRITNTRYGAGAFERRAAIMSALTSLILGSTADSAVAKRARASGDGRRTQYSVIPVGAAAIARHPSSGSVGGQV